MFALAFAVLAAALVLGVLAYRRVSAQVAAREDVARATRLIERADVTIARVDGLVRGQVRPGQAEEAAEVSEDLRGSRRDAREAAELLEGAVQELPAGEAERARDGAEAARARAALLDAARPLLDATTKAAEAIGPAQEGWELLLTAEERSDKAVELYNRHERDEVRESLDLTRQAAGEVGRARTLFVKAAAAMPEADLAPYVEYTEERLRMLDLAEQADRAFLDGDLAGANRLSARFNERERELVRMAERLPASPGEPIQAAYDALVGDAPERYAELRERMTTLR
ncbi:MAG: hypothetical protein IBX62_10185 [Coriobacteriia bacterium]|nr:hypothetical protein [Coriobacteriia bacterium]